MLKVLIDFLESNWTAFSQTPLPFLLTGAIGFVIGILFLKNQNDALKEQNNTLKERLTSKDEKLTEKEKEIKVLKEEVDRLRSTKYPSVDTDLSQVNSYDRHLRQLSNTNLDKEAKKVTGKLEKSCQHSGERKMSKFDTDIALHNEWNHEGKNLLAIKHEILNRLPDELRYSLDRVSDSRYQTGTDDTELILEAVTEIHELCDYLRQQS